MLPARGVCCLLEEGGVLPTRGASRGVATYSGGGVKNDFFSCAQS